VVSAARGGVHTLFEANEAEGLNDCFMIRTKRDEFGPARTRCASNKMKQYETVKIDLHICHSAAIQQLIMQAPTTNLIGSTENSPAAPDEDARSSGFFALLDGLLRRRENFFEDIFDNRRIGERLRWFLMAIVVLSGFYGATMGAIGFGGDVGKGIMQALSSAVKVPALYLLSVAICFPVLYIVLVLMGARLRFNQTLSLILLALTLNAVLLASCAPILLFFMLTGADYHFVKLLHVAVFAFSGGWAMMALWQGLRAMCEKSDLYPRQAIRILQLWILIFGFVGTQMAWSLRPFVGSPDLEFEVFRAGSEGNFYKAVWTSIVNLTDDLVD
jgi:hypothetical protein